MISLFAYLLAAVASLSSKTDPPLDTTGISNVSGESARERKGSIASSSATYDGSTLILAGDICLEHGFGTMKAEKAMLRRQTQAEEPVLEEGEILPFTAIELEEKVRLHLATSAHVECERASLDFQTLRGTLTSPTHVHYVDTIHRQASTFPFELFTPQLDIQMVKNREKQKNYDIEKAHAQKGVHLIYHQFYHLKTEALLFTQDRIQSDGNTPCVWTCTNDKGEEDSIQADRFYLDLTQNHLHLKIAAGNFNSLSKGQIQFTAHDLNWNYAAHHLTLQGSPTLHLRDEEEMTILAETAQIHYQEEGKVFRPEKLELQGHIKIFSQDKEGQARRGIADTLIYDLATRTCILKALPGQKVLFMREQDQLRMSANEVHIIYDPITQEQQVRGIGQITMTLTPEEQNLLNKVFQHGSSSAP